MNAAPRRTALALAATAVAATLTAAPATAEDPAPSRVTAIPSQFQVDPGEEFVIRGRLRSEGEPVGDAVVRVRTYLNGEWRNIKGARVTTNSEGRYRVRVVLSAQGDRLLRVVANPVGDDIKTAKAQVLMQVGPKAQGPDA
jgi:hypothetical protein